MDGILGSIPQLAGIVEKGGIIGLLLIVCAVLVWEIRRGRRLMHERQDELAAVYGQRDLALLAVVKLKTVCEAHDIKVDLSDLQDLLAKAPVPKSGMLPGLNPA